MKKFLIFSLLILSIALTGIYLHLRYLAELEASQLISGITDQAIDSEYTYFKDEDSNIQGVLFKQNPSFSIDETPELTVKAYAEKNELDIVINGSFFTPQNKHAGLLIQEGLFISPPAYLEKQLTHFVLMDMKSDSMSFKSISEYQSGNYIGNPDLIAYQTGPLIIDKGEVQSDLIDASVNGNGKYLRTLLGYNDIGDKVFIITLDKMDLKTLASALIDIPELAAKSNWSFINLDGGSSVAMYFKDDPKMNFGEYKTLPILLGIK